MRLHRLELTAFGPYPKHEVVDFDALGIDGLFLLHGDTGAGKTTILDAVAFALFGSVPGARGEVKRLRCDYAAPDVVTEVALELTVQGHRLRVVRRPEYERVKRSGEGVTTQRAKASLTWIGPAPSGHTPDGLTRIDEVALTVQRLLGMNAEQFFQVVLLPQGEFARFLRSDTGEREVLLERLFGTERFADVEKWFRETRTARGRAVDERRQAVRVLVARAAQSAGEEPPSDDTDANPAWLGGVRDRLSSATASAAKQELVAGENKARAENHLRRQRELADRVRRVRAAHATLAELADAREGRVEQEAELSAARRAVGVHAAQRAVRAAEAEVTAARSGEERSLGVARELAALPSGWSPLAPDALPGLRRRAGDLRDEAGALQPLVAEAEQQRADRAAIRRLETEERTAAGAVAELTATLAALPVRLADARDERDGAVRIAERVAGLTARVAEVAAIHRAAVALPGAERDADQARAAATVAVDAHQAARDTLLDVRARRLVGMAAELAGRLTPGEPCGVCGSVDHPAPATPGAGSVGESEEQAAADAEQVAARRREAAVEAVHDAEHRCAVLRGGVGDWTVEDAADSVARSNAELTEAAESAAAVESLTAVVTALEGEIESARARLAAAERDVAGIRGELAAIRVAVADRDERLTVARGEHPDVPSRRAHLLAVATALDDAAEAIAARLAADARLVARRAEVSDATRRFGFSSEAEALAAVRDMDVIANLEATLGRVDRLTTAAEETLTEPELADVRPDTAVDVDGAERLLADAEEEATTEAGAVRAAEHREREVAGLAERLVAAWAALGPVEAEYRQLAALADVVNGRGQNARRMSLRSYVLAARLTEVAAAATRRLQQVSEGRYSFVRSDAAGPRNTRGGLGLDVLDDYSGQVRPAKTLSGGESFLASLSLALGLADVVAAETGGALLDTLFVDEGFGALDADTLDQVMNTLDELRANGRVVGLVSHVEELRQRIPVRLRVRKARTGSVLELSGA